LSVKGEISFFQLALYALLRAANGVPQLRQRVRDGEVIEYDPAGPSHIRTGAAPLSERRD
jgi:chloramphenicol O-acetyltransferase